MNKTVYFSNKGLIDIRAITTFGVSSKENKDPIGYFGTGLKYAIAICLRLGCTVKIFRGLEEFKFSAVRETIRVDEFDIVHMNNTPLGFTTQLGKNWKMWQAFREIYCNTFDEEEPRVCLQETLPREGFTVLAVTGDSFMEAFHNRDEVILRSTPLYDLPGLEVHPQSSKNIYYRGICVGELSAPSLRTYNITSTMKLTEDRTLDAMWKADNLIRDKVLNSPSQQFIEDVLFAREGSYEQDLSMCNSGTPPNKLFLDTVKYSPWASITNKSAMTLYKVYNKDKPKDPEPVRLNEYQQRQLEETKVFCINLGFPLEKYNIVPTEDMGHNQLGMCRFKGNKMFVNIRAFTLGNRVLATTLIEECVHMSKKLEDDSRDMQNYLFELVVEQGEKLLGMKLESFETTVHEPDDEIPF